MQMLINFFMIFCQLYSKFIVVIANIMLVDNNDLICILVPKND